MNKQTVRTSLKKGNRGLWRSLGAGRGIVYWALIGYWLVPIAYGVWWSIYGLGAIATGTGRLLWPTTTPAPHHPKYPQLRQGGPTAQRRNAFELGPLEVLRAPALGPISTWSEAERVACLWIRHWGWSDARLTPEGADGGIDVISTNAVAQVKFWEKPVPRRDIQNLVGAASTHPGDPVLMFFSRAGYTRDAHAWAETGGICLFTFDEDGVPQPQNKIASLAASRGPADHN